MAGDRLSKGHCLRAAIVATAFGLAPVAADAAEDCRSLGIHFLGDYWETRTVDGAPVRAPARDYLAKSWGASGNVAYQRVYLEFDKPAYKTGMAFHFARKSVDGEILLQEKFSLVRPLNIEDKFVDTVQINLPSLARLIGPLPAGVDRRRETLSLSILVKNEPVCTYNIAIDMRRE